MTTLNTALTSRGIPTKDNLNSSSDPTSANDSTQGYGVGSLWSNSTTGRVWIARSVAVAAAVWTMLGYSDHPGYIANNWYVSNTGAPLNSGTNPGSGSIRLYPAYIRERVTISALGVRVTTLSGGGNVQAAIYANNAATMRPTGNALASTASMSTGATGSVNAAVSVQLEAGMYWFATNCDNATAVFTSSGTNQANIAALIGSATQGNCLTNAATISGISVAQTFGTWPDLTSGSFTEVVASTTFPTVQFKVNSVP